MDKFFCLRFSDSQFIAVWLILECVCFFITKKNITYNNNVIICFYTIYTSNQGILNGSCVHSRTFASMRALRFILRARAVITFVFRASRILVKVQLARR